MDAMTQRLTQAPRPLRSVAPDLSDELITAVDGCLHQEPAKRWPDAKVTPAPRADDAEFVRRAYLDLAGRIPTVAETRSRPLLTDLVNELSVSPSGVAFIASCLDRLITAWDLREAQAVLRDAGVLAERVVRSVCEHDQAACGAREHDALARGLQSLARFWRMTGAR